MKVNLTTFVLALVMLGVLPGVVHAQAWYSPAGWLYRKAITIDHTKVGTGPHTNYPVLISRADADLQTKALATGNDILFTSSDATTKLAHEIESYTSGTGTLVAWVQIPSLSSTVDTVIYMYYGNAAAGAQQNITGTWNTNYKGVWHLNNAFLDATSNNSDGTNTGTTNVAGKISNGRGFVRSDGTDFIQITGLMSSPTSFTLSAWATLTTADPNGADILSLGDNSVLRYDENSVNKTSGVAYTAAGVWTTTASTINYAGTGWHYVVYTFDDVGNSQKLYVDGIQKGATTSAATPLYTSGGTNTFIGKHGNANVNMDFDGTIDEVRVANASRSVGWVLTEYNNQNSPGTFYSVAGEAKIYYSLASGNWNAATTWSNTGHAGAASSTAPGAVDGDYVIIGNNDVVTLNVGVTTFQTEVVINSTGTLNMGTNTIGDAGSFTLNSGGTLGIGSTAGITSSGATGNVQVTGTRTFSTGANYNYNGSSAQVTGNGLPATVNDLTINNSTGVSLSAATAVNGTLTLTSGAHSIGANTLTVNGPISTTGGTLTGGGTSNLAIGGAGANTTLPAVTLNNLTMNRANGITLGGNVTASGVITFTSGNITTGANTLYNSTGSVTHTSGHVIGNFKKNVAIGTPSNETFEIGDATNYTPVSLAFASVTTAGDITVSVASGDHANIGSSTIDPTQSVNRNWTITNSGTIVFTTYGATFTFLAGDLDAGATTSAFIVGKYSGGWTYPTVGSTNPTNTQTTGLNTFGAFQLGEVTPVTRTWDGGAGTNNWGDANNWNANGVPISTDNVDLTGANTININVAAVANNLLLNNAGLILTINSGQSLAVSGALTLTSGTLNMGTNTISGAGSFTLGSGGNLGVGSTAGITSSGATGNVQVAGTRTFSTAGNYTYNGSGAQVTGNGLPATVNNLTINNSAGVTLTAGVAVSSDLTVTSGVFTVGAFSLAVTGATTVTSTLTITSATGAKSFGDLIINGTFTNTAANAPITISGDLQNNGTFSQGTGRVTFTGATSNTVSGTAATTAFGGGMTVNKGSSYATVLDVQSVITMAAGGLTLTNGTFKLSSASTITPFTADITVAPYLIPATAGIWVNGGTVSTTSDVTPAGLIRVSNGTFNVGNVIDARLLSAWATFIIEGGAFNVAGRLTRRVTGEGHYFTMSGGTLTVGTIGNTNATYGPFVLDDPGSSFTMSGGTIVVHQSATTAAVDYTNLAGTTNVTGGTLQIGDASTPAANTIEINSTTPLWNLTINGTNSPVAQLVTNPITVQNDVTITSGTLNANNLNIAVGGNWTNNVSTAAFTAGTGTVTFDGAAIGGSIGGSFATTFYKLTMNRTNGLTLGANITVGNLLTFTSGNITTGANSLYSNSTGTVTHTSGHVIGNFKKNIAIATPSNKTFEIGDATNYTPVTLAFASVSVAGDLTASTAVGDHANIGSSTINASKSVNRNWTLTNSGIVFTNYGATFTFVAGDLDAGATTSAFIVGKYSAGWTYPTVGSKNPTDTQTTGLNTFGAFQLGEVQSVTRTWDGGAGTNNWGDANNWNANGVPISTDNVDLTGANTININVAAVANNLLLNNAGLILTINSGQSLAVSGALTLTSGTLNMGTNTISGAGSFTLGSGGNLGVGSTAGIMSSGATGNVQVAGTRTFSTAGNYTYNGSGAQVTGNGLPATVNNLTINNSAGVTLTAGVAVSSDLTITSGVFTVGAFSLGVTGTTTVTSTLTITSATGAKSFGDLIINGTFTNTAANAPITIAGDLQNNGTFSQGTGRVTFTGAASNTVSGSAASTGFGGGITVNKGTTNANVLDVQSVITMLAGGLTLTNGTFKLSSASTITPFTVDITGSPYLIPSTAGLWCNGGTMNSPVGGMSWNIQGLLRVSAGTVNAGNVTGNFFAPQAGANIVIEGGTLNLADRISQIGSSWTYNMTGGTLTVAKIGSATADRPPFNMDQAGSSFSMSGGTIIVAHQGGSAGQNLGYYNLGTAGTGFTGGTLQIGDGSTPAASILGITSTNAIYNLTVNAASSTAQLQTGALTVTNAVTISAGTLSANNLNLSVGGDWTNNVSTTAFTAGSGTVTFNGAATGGSIGGSFATTFNGLTMNRANEVSLGANITAGGTLTFTIGNITTGANTLYVNSAGTVSRTSGHVIGNFQKNVATGATSKTFEIGDATNYTPATVAFASVSVAGDLTASTAVGDHANIGSSTINAARSVNRNWTLTNSGIVFTNYGATFTFVAGDLDAGATTSAFIAGKYSAATWTYPTVGTKTGTTTQTTGLTTFGDFQLGEIVIAAVTWDGGAGTSNWGDATNWNTNVVPIAADNVDLTGANTININVAAVATNLLLNNASLVLTLNNSLAVSGALTQTAGTLNMGTNTISGAGSFTLSSGGNLGIGSTAGITSSGATGNVQVGGTRTFNTAGNYTYNGTSAQVTGNGLPATVNNLTVNNSAGVTLSATIAVSSDLTVTAGTFDLSSFTANRVSSGGTLTVADGATLKIGATNTFPSNYSSKLLGDLSTIEYSGTAQAVGAQNYGHLTLSNSGLKTFATSAGGNIRIAGALTISGTATTDLLTNTTNVSYYGSGAQTILGLTYYDLTASTSGTKTLAGSATVNNSLTIANSAILDLSTFTANRATPGGTLTLSSTARLKIGGTNTLPSNYSAHVVAATTTVEYSGTTQSVAALNSAQDYGHLIISGSGTKTLAGTENVAGNLTISGGTFDLGANTINRTTAGGTLTLSSGAALKIGGTNPFPSNYTAHSIGATSTVEYSGTTQSVIVLNSAQNYGNLTISGSLTKTLAATISVAGDLAVSAGTFDLGSFTANRASAGAGTLSVAGGATLTIGGTNPFPANYLTHSIGGVSTIEYSGTNQSVVVLNSAQNYYNLTISGSGTKTIAGDLNVAGTLTLSSGTVTTGAYTVYVKNTGTVNRVSGYVIGNLKRFIATGSPTRTFDVGDASNYTPVTIAFASITTAGDLTVSVVSADHANIGSSTINASKSVNRNWILTNSGIVLASYGATFTFVAGDLDAGATTSAFIVGKYSGGWTYPTVGTTTSTSTQTTGLTAFGAFQLGEVVVPPNVPLVNTVVPSSPQPPGTDLVYTVVFTNDGGLPAQVFIVIDPIPGNTDFKLGSVSTVLGTTGLTVAVAYSNDNAATWTYTPVSGGGGATANYDRSVTHVRWTFTGNLSQTSPNNTGSVGLTAKIR